MKQRIELSDLQVLSVKQKKALYKWAVKIEKKKQYPNWLIWEKTNLEPMVKKHDMLPLLTIGEMIEFLSRYETFRLEINNSVNECHLLCDKLWGVVKEVLENE